MIQQLHNAGVSIFRFNFAHETKETASKAVADIREIEKEMGVKIHLLADVEGPGVRTGVLTEKISYVKGEKFKIFVTNKKTEPKSLVCDYPSLPDDVHVGGIIKIDAGLFKVKVVEKGKDFVLVQAQNDFVVGSRRHINLPGVHIQLPSFTDKDKQDVLTAIQLGFDHVALSFVRSAADMQELRTFLDTHNGEHIKTICKIENEEGLQNISSIAQASDIVMVARGDLGTELPIENLPIYQLQIMRATKEQQKKVIVATEILESMIHHPTPTRAEVNDIFYAVVEWADYLMLSWETAVGEYPIQCVETMKKIIATSEQYR